MNKILRGVGEALAFANGKGKSSRVTKVDVLDEIDVKAIRGKMKLTQEEFALRYGFSIGTLRHWEQERRRPVGAARILLSVIDKEPEAVERALRVA